MAARPLRLALLFVFVFVAVWWFISSPRVEVPPITDSIPVTQHRLANGLTVFIAENHAMPTIHAQVVVRAGSRDDPPESTGLAHFMEHLLFNGTDRLGTRNFSEEAPLLDQIEEELEEFKHSLGDPQPELFFNNFLPLSEQAAEWAIPNELARLYTELGAVELNAYTSVDGAFFQVDLPKNRLEHWAKIESERFRNPQFRFFLNELNTTWQEFNQYFNNEWQFFLGQVNQELAKGHPYGRLVLGKIEHLRHPSIKDLKAFYDRYYVPENMALILSGDVERQEALEIIERYFGEWPTRPAPKKETDELAEDYGGIVEATAVDREPAVCLAYRTPGASHPDAELMRMLGAVFNNPHTGFLDNELVSNGKLRNVHTTFHQMKDYGIMTFIGIPHPGQDLEQVRALLKQSIGAALEFGFARYLRDGAASYRRSRLIKFLESNRGRAGLLRDAFIRQVDWESVGEFFDRIRRIEPDRLQAVARRYLSAEPVTGYLRSGEKQMPDLPDSVAHPVLVEHYDYSDFARQVLAMPFNSEVAAAIEQGVHYERLPLVDGVSFYHLPSVSTQLFELKVIFETGYRQDSRWPLIETMWEISGIQGMSESQMAARMFSLGARFSVKAKRQQVEFILTGEDTGFAQAAELFMEWIRRPELDEARFARLKQKWIVDRKYQRRNPEHILSALKLYSLIGKDSRYLREPSTNQLASFNYSELADPMVGLSGHQHRVFYRGPRSAPAVVKDLEKIYRRQQALQPLPDYLPVVIEPVAEPFLLAVHRDQSQATVRVSIRTKNLEVEDVPMVNLFNEYFAKGLSSVMFEQIRQATGEVYAVRSSYIKGQRPGDSCFYSIEFKSAPDQVDKVLGIVSATLAETQISKENFEKARRSLLAYYGFYRKDPRQLVGKILEWERLGLNADPVAAWIESVNSYAAEDLQTFFDRHIKNKPLRISVVGDTDVIRFENLSGIRARRIDEAEVFSP